MSLLSNPNNTYYDRQAQIPVDNLISTPRYPTQDNPDGIISNRRSPPSGPESSHNFISNNRSHPHQQSMTNGSNLWRASPIKPTWKPDASPPRIQPPEHFSTPQQQQHSLQYPYDPFASLSSHNPADAMMMPADSFVKGPPIFSYPPPQQQYQQQPPPAEYNSASSSNSLLAPSLLVSHPLHPFPHAPLHPDPAGQGMSPPALPGHIGIGMVLESQPNGFLVTHVDPRGPADTAGIAPRDLLVGVGGVSAIGRDYVSDLVTGPPNTFVELDIIKPGETFAHRYMVMRVDRSAPPQSSPPPPTAPKSPSVPPPQPEIKIVQDPALVARLAAAEASLEESKQRIYTLENGRAEQARDMQALRETADARVRDILLERDDALKSLKARNEHLRELERQLDQLKAQAAQSVPSSQLEGYALLQRKYDAQTKEVARLQQQVMQSSVQSSPPAHISPKEDLRPRVTVLEQQLQSMRQLSQEHQQLQTQFTALVADRDRLQAENAELSKKSKKRC